MLAPTRVDTRQLLEQLESHSENESVPHTRSVDHSLDTVSSLLGNLFVIRLRALSTVACSWKSSPVSKANRFAFNPLALAALVIVLRGLQQISQTSSSSLLALDSALPCWEDATGDAATDSVTCEYGSTGS